MNHPNLSDDINRKLTFAERNGIEVNELKSGDVLEVRTLDALYRFKIINPATGEVEATSDGQYFQHPEIVNIHGSTFGGSMIKLGWLAVGTWLEIGRIRLSQTQAISLNGAVLEECKSEKAS